MKLDILKTQTTWNDASASINDNFEKVRLALQNGGTGGGTGGGASIPVVSSEEELETLSQEKGDLAVILSEDAIAEGQEQALNLYQATEEEIMMAVEGGIGFLNADSISGISIDESVDVPPCLLLADTNPTAIICPRGYNTAVQDQVVVLDFGSVGEDGLVNSVVSLNMTTMAEAVLAIRDSETGKMTVDEAAIVALNDSIKALNDAVWVYLYWGDYTYSEVDEESQAAVRETFAFLQCNTLAVSYGTKSIRVKGDEGYDRLDSDIVKIVDYDMKGSLGALSMPIGSMVRTHVPEHFEYDTELDKLRCCVKSPEVDYTTGSVVNRLEITRHSTTEPNPDAGSSSDKPPYFILVNSDGSEQVMVRWWMGADLKPIACAYSQDDGQTIIPLLEDGVWDEDNLAALDGIVASGVNILYEIGKYVADTSNVNWNATHTSIYEDETGYLPQQYLDEGYMVYVNLLVSAHFTLYCNERLVPEHIEEYDKLASGWVKKNELANVTFKTVNGEEIIGEGDIVIEGGTEEVYVGDTQPSDENIKIWIDTSVEGTTGGGTSGGSITLDTEMSATSENAVQNKVVKYYIDEEVEGAKEYSEEMADNAEAAAKAYIDSKIASLGSTGSSASFKIYLAEPLTEDSATWFYWGKSGQYCIPQYVKGRKATEVRTPNPNATGGWDVPFTILELDFSKIHTSLTFPTVVWKDGAAPTFEDGARYIVKVFNGFGEWAKYNSIRIFDFKIAGNPCQALEGMTWGEYIDSKYNIYGFYWDGSSIRNPQWSSSMYIADAPSKTTLITEGKNYSAANGAVFPLN